MCLCLLLLPARAEHSGIADGAAAERGGARRALEPAEVVAELDRLPVEAQSPQRFRQPSRIPPKNHRRLSVIIVPLILIAARIA